MTDPLHKPLYKLDEPFKKVVLENQPLRETLYKSPITGKLYFNEDHRRWDENKSIIIKMANLTQPVPLHIDLGPFVVLVEIEEGKDCSVGFERSKNE